MRKRLLLTVVVLAVALAGGGLAVLYLRRPAAVEPLAIQVEATPASVARGRYLFEIICDCDGCHSQRDPSRFALPVIASGRGQGFEFPPEMGLPGRVVAPNITPDKETGIGHWTDGEKIRAIRDGISRDGHALFPVMPYPYYRSMSDDDVQAIVAYMNTLAPIRNALPRSAIRFPASLLVKSAPRPAGSVPPVTRQDKLKWGEYLTIVAGCIECHTPLEKSEAMRLGGGREFRFPQGTVVSANITPDPETGIGRWTERQFLEKIYQYKDYAEKGPPVVGPESFTLMPWLNLCRWSPEELGAVFAYLKTQPPVKNAVETHPGYAKKQS